MVVLLWDASALAKRYAPEVSSDTVDALFTAVSVRHMVSSAITYAEIYSILLRKLNRAAIDRTAFAAAKSSLRAELINNPDFVLLAIDDTVFYRGIALMEKHNLNATDAALMVFYRSYIQSFAPGSDIAFVLVAADERLVRTARAEGFQAVNPEILPATSVPAYLDSLYTAPRQYIRCSISQKIRSADMRLLFRNGEIRWNMENFHNNKSTQSVG